MQTQTSNTLHNAIMEAGSKDRPPMLAPGNYVQWKSRIKRYIDTKPNHEHIHYCLMNPPYELGWIDKEIPISKGSPITRTERFQETYKNVSQDIRDQLNAEAEAVQIILTGIDNDIYSTVDACPNACEMWKAIERLKQGESINVQDLETNLYWEFGKFTSQDEWQRFVTHVKQNQELKTISYHKLYDILKQHQHEVNEIRVERIARVANPLALVAQQQPVYHPQNHPTHYTQNSSTRPQQVVTRNRGKAIINSPQPIYDQEPSMVAEDDETECQKPKRVKDAAYHREKMLLCKQEEDVIQLNAEQADWRADTDDNELEDQELEAHYIYGDLVQGDVTIKRVYYVEGLNHNLFSVGQFCDADLEVAFRKSTCYICDLKRNDLLTGSRGTDLYSITLQDTNCPNPICLMAKASSSQAWLWHHRLSHLNFDTINLLSKNDIVVGLPKLKFVKDHLCSSCELGKSKRKSFHTKLTSSSKIRLQLLHMDLCGPMRVASINEKRYVLVIVDDYSRYTWFHFLRSKDETPKVIINFLRFVQRGFQAQVRIVRTDKGTEFLNQTLHAYFTAEGILHQTSIARTPEQNGVVERRNRTLVEAARTMLNAAKVPLFF
uniref:Retrovirus-related Pol polyprotein from transposon TNT 1-94 n=1 Tax=Tanacetum cinerariifolium TaxID=118510 RepID=A0A6L2MYF8_TANCI|nr:retrovirus-related Pol polyprotein from transposon TNT 1-94 [Tanacetum cinerariifolium]